MHQITSSQFKAAVELDPAWASKLAEPVEITDYCDMERSKITHLSPLLHFTRKDKYGNSANFWFCKSLKVAEGNFQGRANFATSGVEKIGDLTCGKNNTGNSVNFYRCSSLKVAEGRFEGCGDFSCTGIEKLGDLSCGRNRDGIRLDLRNCPKLKSIPFTFNPDGIKADLRLIKDLTATRAFIQKKRAEIMEIII